MKSGEILVLENVRSWDGETKSATPEQAAKTELVQNLAPLADLFVNDAFAAAHRGHVSMVGFTAVLPSAAGRIMERELKSLAKALEKPEKPCVYVMGGAKADDSLEISKYVLGQWHCGLRVGWRCDSRSCFLLRRALTWARGTWLSWRRSS